MFDIDKIRQDFPILNTLIKGKRNTFLDTAASAQKPKAVVDCMQKIYLEEYANVHRGSYYLSEQITEKYELSRKSIARFINAKTEQEIIFTRSATEGINLIASSWGLNNLKEGDEVLISRAEHHANLVTWQQITKKTGATLVYFDLDKNGNFVLENFTEKLSPKTKLVATTAMSNVLGTVFPIDIICREAHKYGALVLVDACQFAVHKKIDVQTFDCDFLVFSGHKLYGPTGIGVLYAKYDLLLEIPPYQYGGDMITTVSYEDTKFAPPPAKFEAGTPAIVQAIGLGCAINYLEQFNFEDIVDAEIKLTNYTTEQLLSVQGLTIYGLSPEKGGVFSFSIDGIHPQDLSFVLAQEGVAIRTGHFCAEPLVKSLGHNSLSRISLGIYSSKEDIDILIKSIYKAKKLFS